MIGRLCSILLSSLLAASPFPAPGQAATPKAEIPAQYREDVARAETLGRLIYEHDKAAWLSTDAFLAISAFKSPPGPMAGWVTQPAEGGEITVSYLAKVAGEDVVFASADIWPDAGGVANVRRLPEAARLTPAERRVRDATKLAIAAGGSLNCSDKPFNTVAFEDKNDPEGGILVFLMSAWTNESAPLGGYEMFRTDATGAVIRERFAQTKGCASMSTADFSGASALAVTHLTSPAPTAFHVFMSLQYEKPVYVSTGDLVWAVENGRIRVVDSSTGIGEQLRQTMGPAEAE